MTRYLLSDGDITSLNPLHPRVVLESRVYSNVSAALCRTRMRERDAAGRDRDHDRERRTDGGQAVLGGLYDFRWIGGNHRVKGVV